MELLFDDRTESGYRHRRRYFLNSSSVDEEQAEESNKLFEKSKQAVFTKNEWALMLNLQSEISAGTPTWQTTFLRIWKIPDLNSLEKVMVSAAYDETFVKLNKLVDCETQSFALASNYDPSFSDSRYRPPQEKKVYIVDELDVQGTQAERNRMSSAMNRAVVRMRSKFDWTLVTAVHCMTGQIPRLVQVWGTDNTEELLEASRYYRSARRPWSKTFRQVIVGWKQGLWKNCPST